MPRRIPLALFGALLMTPAVAGAQSNEQQGRYANINDTITETELPDGGLKQIVTFRQFTYADDQTFPLHNILSDCSSVFLVGADGSVSHASGTCTGSDPEGDLISWSWEMEEAATVDCPDLCGIFSLYGGQGKYDGLTGDGTWQRDIDHPMGGIGRWQLTYSR